MLYSIPGHYFKNISDWVAKIKEKLNKNFRYIVQLSHFLTTSVHPVYSSIHQAIQLNFVTVVDCVPPMSQTYIASISIHQHIFSRVIRHAVNYLIYIGYYNMYA